LSESGPSRIWPRAAPLALACFVFANPALALPSAPETGACSLENATPVTVATVDDDFALLLDDGRRAALTGLEFPPPEAADLRAEALKRLSDWLSGQTVFFGAQGAAPDRWGRAPARVFAAAGAGAGAEAPLVSVGAALLEEGFARFRPDPSAADCAKSYLAAEAPARNARRGVWAIEELRAVDSGGASRDALLRRKGMVVVEGAIRSVGETPGAIYLNFGEKRSSDFAVVISRRNLAMFAGSGIDPRSLAGRRARVRGLIETGFGPHIEIADPAEIEITD
jgi:endonuclease YncB( thermonuclease family)